LTLFVKELSQSKGDVYLAKNITQFLLLIALFTY